MLGLDVISFPISMSLLFFYFIIFNKKGGGGRCRYLFLFLVFQISYVFLPDVSVLGALLFLLLYNFEFLSDKC
jgi:hypothetical protein